MPEAGALLISRQEVASRLTFPECVDAVERALVAQAEGRTLPPAVLGLHAGDGGFHVKAAGLTAGRSWVATKLNANFPANPGTNGRPMIQGVILLCDGADGTLLAIIDSIEITILRTGAATALAARRLALPEAGDAAILGCGNQGRIQLKALALARPLRRARVWDIDPARAREFSVALSLEIGVPVAAESSPRDAVSGADLIATCTPSREPLLSAGEISPGAFIAAVGADNPRKREIGSDLIARSAVVADSLEQCAAFGDLAHALRDGTVTRDHVRAELPEVVAGRSPGRVSRDEILLFDSTGTAVLDVAAAVRVFEKSGPDPAGARFDFNGQHGSFA